MERAEALPLFLSSLLGKHRINSNQLISIDFTASSAECVALKSLKVGLFQCNDEKNICFALVFQGQVMFRNGERMGTIKFNQFQGTLLLVKLTVFCPVFHNCAAALTALFSTFFFF